MILVRITLVVVDARLGHALAEVGRQSDASVEVVGSGKVDWSALRRDAGDVLVIDERRLPDSATDLESVRFLRQSTSSPALVLLAQAEDADRRARLLAAGCEAVLYAGLRVERLAEAFAGILERLRQASGDNLSAGDRSRPRLADMVTASPTSQAFVDLVHRVKDSDVSLLIQGETGSGKEWLARGIHNDSHRGGGPFVALNCGAVPEHLLESELFGHVEGAFTGASRSRRGWFELAHRGTLFLDEIGDMPLHLQIKLLRVLQEHQVQPLGAERSINVNVRVMAATNRNLLEDVGAGRFRRDLYYRLSPVTLTIPPLRERQEDIPFLARHFLEELRPRVKRQMRGITPQAMAVMVAYAWPGNVRELVNILERAMLLSADDEIGLEDVAELAEPGRWRQGVHPPPPATPDRETWRGLSWREAAERMAGEWEPKYLLALLRETHGRIAETARRAGLTTRSIYSKMRKYNLDKSQFR